METLLSSHGSLRISIVHDIIVSIEKIPLGIYFSINNWRMLIYDESIKDMVGKHFWLVYFLISTKQPHKIVY